MTPAEAPNPNYPRWVEDPNARERCHDCAARTVMQLGPYGPQSVPAGPDPRCPFCAGAGWVPRKVKAQSPAHHAAIVGYPVGPDGERLRPEPPTAAEVEKHGYAPDAAAAIAADEARKAAAGIAPYGDNLDSTSGAEQANAATNANTVNPAAQANQVDPLAEF